MKVISRLFYDLSRLSSTIRQSLLPVSHESILLCAIKNTLGHVLMIKMIFALNKSFLRALLCHFLIILNISKFISCYVYSLYDKKCFSLSVINFLTK